MRAYIAFKGLLKAGSIIMSPSTGAKWQYVILGGKVYPALVAPPQDLPSGFGIFASSWNEARNYADEVYIVSPAPELIAEDDDDNFLVLGENGWRARATIALGKYSQDEAASIIIAAHKAGYPQVDGILRWAAMRQKDSATIEELLAFLDTGAKLQAASSPEEKRLLLIETVKEASQKLQAAEMSAAAQHSLDIVFELVLAHPATNKAVLTAVIDIDPRYNKSVAEHVEADEDVLTHILNCNYAPYEDYRCVAQSPNATEPILWRVIGRCIEEGHMWDPVASEVMKNNATEDMLLCGLQMHSRVAMDAAGNPNATERVLWQAIKHEHGGVRYTAIRNPKATEEMLRDRIINDNYFIGMMAARICTTERAMMLAAKSRDAEVASGAARNPNATERVLRQAMKHPASLVRACVLQNPNVTDKIVALGLADPSKKVREAATELVETSSVQEQIE